ncbi:MAG: hypothetical protein KF861_20845 [Planctomycetaceae bacterium]|nr:hypothetical protein [Planctomycetaceae bacterium]
MRFSLTDRYLPRTLIAVSLCGMFAAATVLPGCVRNPWTVATGGQGRVVASESQVERTAAWNSDGKSPAEQNASGAVIAATSTTTIRPLHLGPAAPPAEGAGTESRLDAVLNQRRRDQMLMAESNVRRTVPAARAAEVPPQTSARPERLNPWEPQISARERARLEQERRFAVTQTSASQPAPAIVVQHQPPPTQNSTNRFSKDFDVRLDTLRQELNAREGKHRYAGKATEETDSTPFWADVASRPATPSSARGFERETKPATADASTLFEHEPTTPPQHHDPVDNQAHVDSEHKREAHQKTVRLATIDLPAASDAEAGGPQRSQPELPPDTKSKSRTSVPTFSWDDEIAIVPDASSPVEQTSAEAEHRLISNGGVRLLPPVEDTLTADFSETFDQTRAQEDRRSIPAARHGMRFSWPTEIAPSANAADPPATDLLGPERIDRTSDHARPIGPSTQPAPEILLNRGSHRPRFTEHADLENPVSGMQLAEYRPLSPVHVAQAPPLAMTGDAPSRAGGMHASNDSASSKSILGAMPDARWRLPLLGIFGGMIVMLAAFRLFSRGASHS